MPNAHSTISAALIVDWSYIRDKSLEHGHMCQVPGAAHTAKVQSVAERFTNNLPAFTCLLQLRWAGRGTRKFLHC